MKLLLNLILKVSLWEYRRSLLTVHETSGTTITNQGLIPACPKVLCIFLCLHQDYTCIELRLLNFVTMVISVVVWSSSLAPYSFCLLVFSFFFDKSVCLFISRYATMSWYHCNVNCFLADTLVHFQFRFGSLPLLSARSTASASVKTTTWCQSKLEL